jgi:cell division protein FtsQ
MSESGTRGRRIRLAAAAAGGLLLLTTPWWGPPLLSNLAFFRARKVEIRGATYLSPSEVLSRLAIDSGASVWDDPEPWISRLEQHPQVESVRIERRLPGTLVVVVEENLPVALVPARTGFTAIDGAGRQLPIDPAGASLDLPILASRDTALARLLAELRATYPSVFARISEVRREGRNELLLRLQGTRVRALASVTAARLAELGPVEADLARRHLPVYELDLRYRDQVIARIQ